MSLGTRHSLAQATHMQTGALSWTYFCQVEPGQGELMLSLHPSTHQTVPSRTPSLIHS